MASFYTEIVPSKNNLSVPKVNQIALHSLYAPEREAESFANNYDDKLVFFIVGGLAGGYHIASLLNKNPERKIIVVENSSQDFDYLIQIEQCKELSENPNVIFCTIENLFETIIKNFIAPVYSTINLAFLRSWQNIFSQSASIIETIVKKAVQTVMADYSVQRAFGKIWQKNIFKNLAVCKNLNSFCLNDFADTSKNCAIIAAGPTLDKSINELKCGGYFIIATDTTYPVLLQNNINPNIVISLDGQAVSRNHFLNNLTPDKKTIFAFDLCCEHSCVKKVIETGNRFFFFASNHPLAQLANLFQNSFVSLQSGTGTVTIAACDLAFKLGFSKIKFFGADFSYLDGKPYAKGTYLEKLYSINQTKLQNKESKFCQLMFRTPLVELKKNQFTNEILDSYKKSLEIYLENPSPGQTIKIHFFDYENFLNYLNELLNSLDKDLFTAIKNPESYILLPLMAWYQKNASVTQSYELALTKTLGYTKIS
ncbi:MAG: DUF115 domain-containing protein [Treponema sp.]|nr:DUF115 domain-containing protein [Treponema sp.]